MQTEKPILIGIVDDHQMFVDGLEAAILRESDSIRVVLKASNGLDCLEQLKNLRRGQRDRFNTVRVILLDLDMEVMDGEETFVQLKNKFPDTRVIIMSSFYSPSIILKYMREEAACVLPKTATGKEVCEAILAVARSGRYVDDRMAKVLQKALSSKQPGAGSDALNVSEKQVLRLMCMGHTTPEIAERISRSPRSVDSIRNSLWKKSGVKSGDVTGLTLWGIQNGFLLVF